MYIIIIDRFRDILNNKYNLNIFYMRVEVSNILDKD